MTTLYCGYAGRYTARMSDPIAMLKAKLRTNTQQGLAKELGLSPQFLSDIVTGRRPPSIKLLEALGLERVVTYRRINARAKSDSRPPGH
jgi:transcriptional regulator with XRE-family HTH domain